MKTNIKVIATSLSLATSMGAVAGIGGLSVQSHLGQPFSGSIVVSGDEARALIESGSVNVSGSGIRGSIVKQGEDRVVVRLRSSSPVREPVITFTVSAGRQTREYTAFLDPVRYTPKEAPIRQERHDNDVERGEQEMRQGGKKQQKQHDFIERKKPTEERRPASSVPAKADSEEMTVAKKTSKVAVSSRRHRAHAGENVASIAERYRPRNMSQQAAVRALMLANPSAFKHGTTIRRNVTLYIPTESQWHAYAQRAQKQVMKERVKQVRKTAPIAPQQPATVDMPAVDTTPVVEPPKPVTPPRPAEPAKVEPKTTQSAKPAETKVDTANKTVEATKPSEPQQKKVEPAKTEPVKEVKGASVAESSSQPIKPAQPESASKADTASQASRPVAPVAASGASATASAAAVKPRPPVKRPPVVEEPVEPIEEETDYLPLLAAGLGGAAVLGGVGYAIMRRRKNAADQADEGEWSTEEASQSNQEDEWGGDIDFGAAATKSTGHSVTSNTFDDEYVGDDEFSLDKVSPAPATTSTSKDEFSLDNFEPAGNAFDTFDDTQFTPSSNRQNDDWAWVEGEAPAAPAQSADDNFVVAEEDEWSMDKLDSISEVNKKTEQTFSLDDFVVDDIQPAASTAAVNIAKQNDSFDLSDFEATQQPENTSVQADDVFDLDTFDVPATEVKPAVQAAADDDLAFDLNDFVVDKPVAETPVAPVAQAETNDDLSFSLDDFVVPEPVAETPAAPAVQATDDLSFGLDAFEDFTPAEPVAESKPEVQAADDLSFGLDAFEDFTPAEPVAENKPEVQAADDLSFGLDAFEDFTPAEPVAESKPEVQAADDLAFGLDAFEDFTPAEPVVEKAAIINDALVDLPAFDDSELTSTTVQTTTSTQTSVTIDDDLSFGLDAFEDFDMPAEPVAESKPEVQAADDLSFGLDAFEDFDMPAEPVAESKPEVQAADDLSFGLDAFEDFDMPAEPVAESKPEVQAADDLSFGLDAFEDFDMPAEPVAESKPVVQAADDLAFGLDAFEDFDMPAEPATTATDDLVDLSTTFDDHTLAVPAPESTPAVQAAIDEDLSFGLDAFDDVTPVDEANSVTSPSIETAIANVADFDGFELANEIVTTPNVAESPISFDVPAVEEPVISLEAPTITESLDDLSLDIDVMPTPPTSAPVGMLDLATGPLASSSTLDAVNLDNLEVIDDLQGWEASSNENVGFVSGAVSDMTEPLEAKFELAKMYLEIDDAVAARETLRELISESTGNIQEQAKQLLADLGN